jgi:phosphomannomutase
VRHRRAFGGIAVTASHNPAEWNALKFIGSSGLFLNAGQARELLDIYHQGEYTKVRGDEMRSVEVVEGATDLHISTILEALGPLPERRTKLRVVLDSCNGAVRAWAQNYSRLWVRKLFRSTLLRWIVSATRRTFARDLGDLCKAVIQHQADIGFAQDMDADRLAIVSEKGIPIGEDYTLVLATLYALERERVRSLQIFQPLRHFKTLPDGSTVLSTSARSVK